MAKRNVTLFNTDPAPAGYVRVAGYDEQAARCRLESKRITEANRDRITAENAANHRKTLGLKISEADKGNLQEATAAFDKLVKEFGEKYSFRSQDSKKSVRESIAESAPGTLRKAGNRVLNAAVKAKATAPQLMNVFEALGFTSDEIKKITAAEEPMFGDVPISKIL